MRTVEQVMEEVERMKKLADTFYGASNKITADNEKEILDALKTIGIYKKDLNEVASILRSREYQLKDAVKKVEVDI